MKGRTYRYFDDPLFAFGYGQSYTTFEIGDATIVAANKQAKDDTAYNLQVSIPVTNTGHCDGTEIVQLYIRNTVDTEGPLKTLRGFQRVEVKAGQTGTATICLTKKSFECFDPETNTMRTKPGTYQILYGNSSQTKDLKTIEVEF